MSKESFGVCMLELVIRILGVIGDGTMDGMEIELELETGKER